MTLLKREFAGREEMLQYLKEQFSTLPGQNQTGCLKGGRSEGIKLLDAVDPLLYAKTRNQLDGAVTRLSPYIRHGALNLSEIAVVILGKAKPRDCLKLLQELAWRDYFQRVYRELGDDVWLDIEETKCGVAPEDYEDELPEDIATGNTGLSCMDEFIKTLIQDGYLHNHARMYLASYVIHFRRVSWQAGARWFLTHLLDGDEASNNLSWQWVGSTFGSKPYIFNRENLEKYHPKSPCNQCQKHSGCPFEGTYEELSLKLFPKAETGMNPND